MITWDSNIYMSHLKYNPPTKPPINPPKQIPYNTTKSPPYMALTMLSVPLLAFWGQSETISGVGAYI